jgi:hypothetical protein
MRRPELKPQLPHIDEPCGSVLVIGSARSLMQPASDEKGGPHGAYHDSRFHPHVRRYGSLGGSLQTVASRHGSLESLCVE